MESQITEEIIRPVSIFRGNSGKFLLPQITMNCVDIGKQIFSSSELSESEAVHSDCKSCEEAENVKRISSFCTIINEKVAIQNDA